MELCVTVKIKIENNLFAQNTFCEKYAQIILILLKNVRIQFSNSEIFDVRTSVSG